MTAKSQNKGITAVLLLAVIAGAALQLVSWDEARENGLAVVGGFVTMAALALLALFAPRYARQLNHPLRDWRINLFISLLVMITLFVLIAFVYARYYGPIIESIGDGGKVESLPYQIE